MPKIIIVHRLIIRVIKVLDPYRGIRIDLDLFFLYKIFSAFSFSSCSCLNIHIGVLEFQFTNIYSALSIIRLFSRNIHGIHNFRIIFIRIFTGIPDQVHVIIDLSSGIEILSHSVVVIIHILLIRSHFFVFLIHKGKFTNTFVSRSSTNLISQYS